LRPTNTVVFCAIDALIPISGKPLTGFPEFLENLAQAGIPCVWVSARNRHQLDLAYRRSAHGQPFIAEGGCATYLAEDYFHLKPPRTVRLGRFIAIPVAKPQPTAAEALELLAEETGITVVPLSSLSPRELIQNTGLPRSEADLVRQRDFDELFFFAGASDQDIQHFQKQAAHRKFAVRPYGALWSLAVDASVAGCVRELRKLYDRSFHKPAFSVAIATASDRDSLFPACDRAVLLTDRTSEKTTSKPSRSPAPKLLPLFGAETWSEALESIQTRAFQRTET
jgi:predicted mannosyl-3-phosphoglycerate phosphatase (HAD superfamily)